MKRWVCLSGDLISVRNDPSLLIDAVWHATNSLQQDIATHSDGATRYDPEISPFAALKMWGDLAPLKSIVPVGDAVGLLSPTGECHVLEAGWQEVSVIPVHQMVSDCQDVPEIELPPGFRKLGQDDRPAMLALAQDTDPGPFEINTEAMGSYWGIEEEGLLIAMAGERIRMPGWTEISGVCTRPQVRGRGYAQRLVRYLQAQVGQQGTSAFLHVRLGSESEKSAIRAYENVGFEHHRQTLVQVLLRTE